MTCVVDPLSQGGTFWGCKREYGLDGITTLITNSSDYILLPQIQKLQFKIPGYHQTQHSLFFLISNLICPWLQGMRCVFGTVKILLLITSTNPKTLGVLVPTYMPKLTSKNSRKFQGLSTLAWETVPWYRYKTVLCSLLELCT